MVVLPVEWSRTSPAAATSIAVMRPVKAETDENIRSVAT
jgi:hypothetical protein